MQGVSTTERDASTPGGEWGYRPHLDGLRAVAVYLVVAYHTGIGAFSGGFIGVDVFFVLSGYLVTQVLLRDVRERDRIDLRRFYARRVRRLLPAAAVTLLLTAVVFAAVGSPAAVADARDAVRAAALYAANWFFIGRSDDYFGTAVSTSPVIHFWSLAVEEQFYVAWPLLLGGLVALARRAGRRRWAVVRAVVAIAAAASAVAAVIIAGSDLNRAYYGTDTRAYQLLAGALLALSPGVVVAVRRLPGGPRVAPAVAVLALAAIPVAALGRVDVGPVTRGLATTAIVVVLLVALEAVRSGPVAGALALPSVVYLGRISYGTYLWHWPVVVVLGEVVELSPGPLTFVTVLVATGLASLSYQVLELPIRTWKAADRWARPVVAVGLAASVVVGMLVVPRVLDPGAAEASAQERTASVGARAASVDWEAARVDTMAFPECTAADPEQCTLVEGGGDRVLLIGDSQALTLIPMLEEIARAQDIQFSAAVRAVCPWQQGLQYRARERADACRAAKTEWYDTVVPALDPDVVVVAHRSIDDPGNTAAIVDDDLGYVEAGTPAMAAAVEARTRATVDALLADGRRVVIMEPIPVTSDEEDPLPCLAEADDVAECRFVANRAPTPLERLYREVAEEQPEVWAADIDQQVCPFLPICDPVVDGTVVRRDAIHLTLTYSRTIAEGFGAYLTDNDILI